MEKRHPSSIKCQQEQNKKVMKEGDNRGRLEGTTAALRNVSWIYRPQLHRREREKECV